MNEFVNLNIWNNPHYSNLDWYYAVSTNRKPAKYLICKFIKISTSLDANIEDLWKTHEIATKQLEDLWRDIRYNNLDLSDLKVEFPNLLDLNKEIVNRLLEKCSFCEWNCNVNRTKDGKSGTCKLDSTTCVSTYFHHRGEELIYRGTMGSGTIFFTSCNMRCSFCQNGDISKDKNNGQIITPCELANIIMKLRLEGCHNINFVGGDPIVHLHTIISALTHLNFKNYNLDKNLKSIKSDSFVHYPIKKEYANYNNEFNTPLLWNSNMFISEQAMNIIHTLIDIWLPDFKFGNSNCARRLSRTPKYYETITRNHDLLEKWNENYTIRHLIMPNHVECCSIPILTWIKPNLHNYSINIMDQYHPDSFTNPNSINYNPRYEDISRFPTRAEINRVFNYAKKLNLRFEAITFD